MVDNTNNNLGDTSKQSHNTGPVKGAGDDKMRQDISRILEEVQLPDRKEFSAQADRPRPAATPQRTPTSSGTVPSPNDADIDAVVIHENTPTDATAAEDAAPPQAQKQEHSIIRPLHTLKDDLGTIVQSKKMSLVRAAALESDKVRPQTERIEQEVQVHKVRSRRRTGIIVAIIMLVGIGMLALGAVLLVESQRQARATPLESTSLMFAEQTLTLPMDDLAPREAKLLLAQAREQANVTLGSITRIAPFLTTPATQNNETGQRLITSMEFLDIIGANAPGELTRALGNEFFLGIHAVDRTAPLMVFTVTSYERAFAAMLAWESSMSDGLAPFYPAVFQSAQSEGTSLSVVQFEDALVRNFDARILKDTSGEVRLLYAFPTRNILIIAESPYSFVEALSRLQAERRL